MAPMCHWRVAIAPHIIFCTIMLSTTSLRARSDQSTVLVIFPPARVGRFRTNSRRQPVPNFLQSLWQDESGQDIAEYAVMLAVILVIVVGTVRLIGSNANTVFSQVGSAIQ